MRAPLFSFLLLLLACAPDGPGTELERGAIEHPIRDALLSERTDVPVNRVGWDGPTGAAGPSPWIEVLSDFDVDTLIGEASGSEALTFGELADAVVMNDGRYAVLDVSYGTVRLFSDTGEPIGTFGSIGEGPGELTEPISLLMDGDRLGVVDRVGRKIEWYLPPFDPDGAGPATERSTAGLVMLADACMSGPELLASGIASDAEGGRPFGAEIVHVLDRSTGEVRSSWTGPYPHSGSPLVASTMADALDLICDPYADRVYSAHGILREIHAFDSEGTLLWITVLADTFFPRIVEIPGESIYLHPDDAGHREYVSEISQLDENTLAVQVRSIERNLSDRTEVTTYRTYLLDSRTGASVGGFRSDHEVIGGGSGRAVLYRSAPFPALSFVRLRK